MTEPNEDWTKLSQTVELLLKNGADVAAKNTHGDTPLHEPAALCSPDMSILDKLISYGGDVKSKNIQGLSPIEKLVYIRGPNTNQFDKLKIFQKYGYKINSWNSLTGEGYVAKIFLRQDEERGLLGNSEFQKFLKSSVSDVSTIDSMGRTIIHNSVAQCGDSDVVDFMYVMLENYIYAIRSFIKLGIDVEHRDQSGQTALHYATRMENVPGVKTLLTCGADVNIVDKNNNSSIYYSIKCSKNGKNDFDSFEENVTQVLYAHVKKLEHLGVEVSEQNRNLVKGVKHLFDRLSWHSRRFSRTSYNVSKEFLSQVEMTKTQDIGTDSLTLFDFLSETGALTLYPLLLESSRELINDFYKSIDYGKLDEIEGIVRLQCRKMTTRLGLIDSAFSSLRMLLGFSVPGLCEQISRFLFNSDLESLIASTT